MGGSITGEHGVGLEKRVYLAEMYGPADMDFMSQSASPSTRKQLANRGKMLPEVAAPGAHGRRPAPLEQQGVIFRD